MALNCCAVAALWEVASAPAARADDLALLSGSFEATITGATDYVDRGISETGHLPALQGTLDYSLDNGLYAELFASSVHFDHARAELDYSLGWERNVAGIHLDGGITYATYPGSPSGLNYNYWEANLDWSRDFGPAKLLGKFALSPDYFGSSGTEAYAEIGPDFRLPLDLTLSGRVGQQWVEDPDRAGLPDFLNWQIGISHQMFGFTGTLRYTETNAGAQCGFGRECGQVVLFELSRKLWPWSSGDEADRD
jgi:uncharacterized protein (TIGR02001 family)